jgi:hypothetical protein
MIGLLGIDAPVEQNGFRVHCPPQIGEIVVQL